MSRMLSDEAVEEYRKIVRSSHGLELDAEVARTQAEALLRLYEGVFKPVHLP